MEKQIVIGAGEVGRAIAAVLQDKYDVVLRDIGDPLKYSSLEPTLHICFPYGEAFIGFVKQYQKDYNPRLIVIHSTVPIGTTEEIMMAVHSPVTGRHPYLEESIRTFTKFFGGLAAVEAAAIFKKCGVDTRVVDDSCVTEAGKLFQTLQFGWLVMMQKEIYEYCNAMDIDPEVAYKEFNDVYNDGYEKLGEEFFLPTIHPMRGPIGGHCIIPNTHLLDDFPMARKLRMFNERYEE